MLATKDMRELKLEMPSVQLQVAAAALASERAENAAAMAVQKHTATAPTGPNMAESSEERAKFIGRQLLPFNTEAFIVANSNWTMRIHYPATWSRYD